MKGRSCLVAGHEYRKRFFKNDLPSYAEYCDWVVDLKAPVPMIGDRATEAKGSNKVEGKVEESEVSRGQDVEVNKPEVSLAADDSPTQEDRDSGRAANHRSSRDRRARWYEDEDDNESDDSGVEGQVNPTGGNRQGGNIDRRGTGGW